jgi:hypothetical protein
VGRGFAAVPRRDDAARSAGEAQRHRPFHPAEWLGAERARDLRVRHGKRGARRARGPQARQRAGRLRISAAGDTPSNIGLSRSATAIKVAQSRGRRVWVRRYPLCGKQRRRQHRRAAAGLKEEGVCRSLEKAQALQLIAARAETQRQIIWLVSPLDGSHAL